LFTFTGVLYWCFTLETIHCTTLICLLERCLSKNFSLQAFWVSEDVTNTIWYYGFFSFVWLLQMEFSVLKKCYFWCHFLTMLDLKIHSCVDLAHVYGYSSDCGSFRDCVVSHCVQFRFYTLTSVCVRALPVGHLWSQAKRRVWSPSCWILLLSTVSYRKYLY